MDDERLTCGHCGTRFLGSKSQVKHAKYEPLSTFYCSPICRTTAVSAKMRTPVPVHGPCPTCGAMFESRIPKIFCSQACYLQSPQLKQLLEANIAKNAKSAAKNMEAFRAENTHPCMECGAEFYRPPAKNRRFCSRICYRSYLAKRFDRWVASPQRIALPQNFDEFLTQEELPCLVEGCGWTGQWLSNHMNLAHGVPAEDFKRAAGFNLGSGIVAAPLQKVLAERDRTGVALFPEIRVTVSNPTKTGYKSLEGREHAAKARALALAGGSRPERSCEGCGAKFVQTTPFGRTKFCSKECRASTYLSRKAG